MALNFDVIVVGAGPAGSSAALVLARAGLNVALVERGSQPGSKNMFGGLLHNTPVLSQLIPDFWEKAPIERHIYQKNLMFVTGVSSLGLTFSTANFNSLPYNGATVMRPMFDRWLAQQAVEAGATLICNCTADDLVWNGRQVVGVKISGRQGELRSQVVIAADGVLSLLAGKAGLRGELPARNMGLGIKLLLGLDREVIEQRFGVIQDEGADFTLIGLASDVRGAGFLYTNQESISVGMVVNLESFKASGKTPYDLMNQALTQPMLQRLLKRAVPLEYAAHLIPEGGLKGVPRLYRAGLLIAGDAAGLCYSNGLNLEGMNLAITSGALAAETAVEAIKEGDLSARKLAGYRRRLEESFLLKDLRTFSRANDMLQIERVFTTYPELVNGVVEKIFRVDGKPRSKLIKIVRQQAAGRVKLPEVISDGFKIGRALL